MKYLIRTLLIIILLTSVQSVQAQFTYGIKAGVNLCDINQYTAKGVTEKQTKVLLGYHVGPVVNYSFNKAISLQSGLLFSRKGYGIDLEQYIDEPNETYEGSSKVIYNYFEIPLNINYNIKNFQVYAGPYVAIGIKGKRKRDYTYISGDGTDVVDEKRKITAVFGSVDDLGYIFNALDYGLNFGLGYQTKFILINAGYSRGLSNIIPQVINSDYTDNNKIYNSVITISMTYQIDRASKRQNGKKE